MLMAICVNLKWAPKITTNTIDNITVSIKLFWFIGSWGGLAPNGRQAINNDDQVLGRHIMSVGLNYATHMVIGLTHCGLVTPHGDIDLSGLWFGKWPVV